MDALDHRLPVFVRPSSSEPDPAHGTWRSPSLGEQVVQGAGFAASAVIDGAFGSVWSTREYCAGTARLTALLNEDATLRADAQARPAGVSPTQWRTVLKNNAALLLRNRYDRHQQQVRRGLHGVAAGAGGAAYGLGWCLNPSVLNIGHFAGYPAAVTAASTALLWVGGPLLSVAAIGVAIHEGFRLHRNRRVREQFPTLCERPVLGHEELVRNLLTHRANQVRMHGAFKLASMVGLAVGAPLLIVGAAPGGAALGAAGIGAGWASYYLHTRLVFVPQLNSEDLLPLGRRDLMNRIVLTDDEHARLKALKEGKRPLYPRGAQGFFGPVVRAKHSLTSWWSPPAEGEAPHRTVARYLLAQAGAEEAFIQNQLQLNARAAGKAAGDPQRRQELARLDGLLMEAWTQVRAEASALQRGGRGLDGPHDAEPVPGAGDIADIAVILAHHVERHRLGEPLLRSFKRDRDRTTLEAHGAVVREGTAVSLALEQVVALCGPGDGVDPETRAALSRAFVAAGERFLLTRHKQNVRYQRDQLLDFLAYRLQASTRPGYGEVPAEDAPGAPVAPPTQLPPAQLPPAQALEAA